MKRITWAMTILACAATVLSCTVTQQRAFVRRDANVNDYLYFTGREISGGDEVAIFTDSADARAEDILKNEFGAETLQKMIDKTKTQALLVIRGRSMLLEKYGKGYARDSIVTSFSVAKSFNSAMIGTLLESGKLKSLDEPITDYIPELLERDSRFGKITVRNLLSMSSGLAYEEKPSRRADDTETYYNPNLRKLALTKTEIRENPGTRFHYNNYNPLLLGLIIERASGQSVASYLSDAVWSKIGAEGGATWSLDSAEDGFEKMESGINARAIDFARFGCMYRDKGIALNRKVIGAEWIASSLGENGASTGYYTDAWGKQIEKGIRGGHYGLAWYVLDRPGKESDFFAFGNKGQIIYISPNTDIVIVRFGKEYGMDAWAYIRAFYDACTMLAH